VLESSVSTATTLLRFDVNALGHGIEITWQLSSADPSVRSWVERAVTEQGPWVRPVLSSRSEGGFDRELDEGVDPGETYFYRLQVSTADAGTTTLGTKSVRAERDPNAWALSQPMPNPVSATIHVELSLPERASISLALFDLAGRRRAVLARGEYPAGSTRVDWNRFQARTTLPPGLYFLRLDGAPRLLSRRVIIAP
jgi:hypothetical protein